MLASLQPCAALLKVLFHGLDLVRHLGLFLLEKLRLRLRHLHDLPDLREAPLERHELGLLRLLRRPQALGLALEALVDLLELLAEADLVALEALELLLARRRLLTHLRRVGHELLRHLSLLLRGHDQLLKFLLLEGDILGKLHVLPLKLLKVHGGLLHLGLDAVVVLEVSVVLSLDGPHILLIGFHPLAVLLHVSLQDPVLLL
mmetsp:Transcript_98266/g.278263  ORF Transcript_98266/g.278263 Transcript_98266/m.278263 type:complete len:203 (+) Transcript_98266:2554-3162(+)